MSKKQISLFLTQEITLRKNLLLSYLLMMTNLNKKTSQNTKEFILINNYHGLSTLKSQITNLTKELVF